MIRKEIFDPFKKNKFISLIHFKKSQFIFLIHEFKQKKIKIRELTFRKWIKVLFDIFQESKCFLRPLWKWIISGSKIYFTVGLVFGFFSVFDRFGSLWLFHDLSQKVSVLIVWEWYLCRSSGTPYTFWVSYCLES